MSRVIFLVYQLHTIIITVADAIGGGKFHNFSDYTPRSPVVGVLALPPQGTLKGPFVSEFVVEFLEGAGIQVAPVLYDDPNLESLLSRLNGIYLSDGSIDITFDHPYVKAASRIYQFALDRYSKDGPFPLIGFCQGHQILAALAAGTTDVILKHAYKTDDVALTLKIIGNGGRMLGSLPSNVKYILENNPVTPNLHRDGVPPGMWGAYKGLKDQFVMTSTSKDPYTQQDFSATMESQPGKPVMYGLQWHPEMIPYNWDPLVKKAIVKTEDSFLVSSSFSFFVGSLFRGKTHKFSNPRDLAKALVRSYPRLCEEDDVVMGTCVYLIQHSS
ncbi:hypothetical protein FOL47_010633 [Perkinsus chesapeaki]|uniref:folate gamma-glutamyl hydrolase n=1 Tax=Perkinsus chesapeaki TaxID=330153 RepID=A0A7J6MPZ5_PERCH|nr:hypothetical protein FOL47_010633 [Perkinsus chesapeaki]